VFEGWGAGLAVAGAVTAAGTVAGSSIAAGGEKAAANTQEGMFNTIQGNEEPFIQGGQSALNALLQGEGLTKGSSGGVPNGYLNEQFNPTQAQLNAYPGYQFQLQTGGQALENANTPGVGALSGSALKSLMSFNQGTAASNYQNYFNQFQTQQNNIFNRLSSIAGLGQNAAGNLGNNGAQLATGVAQAQAAGAGSIASGVSSAAGSLGQSISLNSLLANGGGFNSGGGSTGYTNSGIWDTSPGTDDPNASVMP
jgi:hypothetical protein